MTYQAASGAGAKHMRELVAQMRRSVHAGAGELGLRQQILALDRLITAAMRNGFPTAALGAPLAGSLHSLDRQRPGQRPDARGVEGHRRDEQDPRHAPATIPVDGVCVRVGAMRCHSQALTIKLTRDVPLDEIDDVLGRANEWVRLVPERQGVDARAA